MEVKNKVKQTMMVVFICILSTLLIACQKEADQSLGESNSQPKAEEEIPTEIEKKVFQPNEEAVLTDESGKEIYSLTINSVEEVSISDEYKDSIPTDSQQTVVVTYTYKYINEDSDLETIRISHSDDLSVYDETGLSADFIDLRAGDYPFDSDTPDIFPGRSAKTYRVFSLKNESDVIQIDSGSANFGMFSFNGYMTFELPVEKP